MSSAKSRLLRLGLNELSMYIPISTKPYADVFIGTYFGMWCIPTISTFPGIIVAYLH